METFAKVTLVDLGVLIHIFCIRSLNNHILRSYKLFSHICVFCTLTQIVFKKLVSEKEFWTYPYVIYFLSKETLFSISNIQKCVYHKPKKNLFKALNAVNQHSSFCTTKFIRICNVANQVVHTVLRIFFSCYRCFAIYVSPLFSRQDCGSPWNCCKSLYLFVSPPFPSL